VSLQPTQLDADDDIVYDIIMSTREELQDLREEVSRLKRRVASIRPREVEGLLDRLSIRRRGGREPYVWNGPRGERPITVPRHGSRTLAEGTARSILADIEDLIDEREADLESEAQTDG